MNQLTTEEYKISQSLPYMVHSSEGTEYCKNWS